MDRVELNNLFDLYESLLTKREKEIFKYYYQDDYSLGEIAENLNISRTAVFNAIKNVTEKLTEYEEKLKLLQKQTILKETINLEDITKITEIDISKLDKALEEIIKSDLIKSIIDLYNEIIG